MKSNQYLSITKEIFNLDKNQPIYICGHINPDYDSVCSCLALCLILKTIGKDAYILLEKENEFLLSWLKKIDKTNYFDYTSIVLDSIPISKLNNYTMFCLDLNKKSRLGIFEKYFDNSKITFNIDHHEDNKFETTYKLSFPEISSTAEIIFFLIKSMESLIKKISKAFLNLFDITNNDVAYKNQKNKQLYFNLYTNTIENNINKKDNFVEINDNIIDLIVQKKKLINKQIAEILYAGIITDTKCFSSRISKKTLEVSQRLLNYNIDFRNIIRFTHSMRTMYEIKAFSKLINLIQFKDFHYIVMDMNDESFSKLTHNVITKKLVEDLRKIEDIDTLVVLMKKDDSITGAIATNTNDNAYLIASLFNGGGHKRGAGFSTEKLKVNEIIEKIRSYLKENKYI